MPDLHTNAIKARDDAQALAHTLMGEDNDATVDAQALACDIQDCIIDPIEAWWQTQVTTVDAAIQDIIDDLDRGTS